jgi:hypothetical protein
LEEQTFLKQRDDFFSNVEPNTDVTVNIAFKPKRAGKSTIVAKFLSKELDDVDGFVDFMVSEGTDNDILSNNIS